MVCAGARRSVRRPCRSRKSRVECETSEFATQHSKTETRQRLPPPWRHAGHSPGHRTPEQTVQTSIWSGGGRGARQRRGRRREQTRARVARPPREPPAPPTRLPPPPNIRFGWPPRGGGGTACLAQPCPSLRMHSAGCEFERFSGGWEIMRDREQRRRQLGLPTPTVSSAQTLTHAHALERRTPGLPSGPGWGQRRR